MTTVTKNPYLDWLAQAKIDFKSAKTLYEQEEYCNAAFLFQQSVEKACKFFGLSRRLITMEKIRKIGHKPHEVFREIFTQEEVKPFLGPSAFDDLFRFMVDRPNMDERVNAVGLALYDISSKPVIPRKSNQSAKDALIDYYSGGTAKYFPNHELAKLLGENRGNLPDDFYEALLIDTDNICKTPACLMHLSFLVFGTEQDSRYPGETSPSKLYNSKTMYMQEFESFCELFEYCLECLEKYEQEVYSE